MASVRLENIRKSFGDADVLSGIDLEVGHGEFIVLVGPSGCGKSTLLRMISGLEEITAGTVRIGERVVNDLAPARRGIAMVFQSYALYPHMTVYGNMAFGLRVAGEKRATIDERVRRAARTLRIDHLLERLPRDLSGGQRQRVAIGRAIVREPELFLFDEPLSNLDAELRVQTRLELARLHRQLGATVIYVTHDQVEAMTLGDRIVVMHEGRIQQSGSPVDVYRNPCNRFVAGFIGTPRMNLLECSVVRAGAQGLEAELAGGGRLLARVDGAALRPGEPVLLGLRAEHARPAQDAGAAQSLRGRVVQVEHLGEANNVYVALAGGAEVVVRGPAGEAVRAGEEYAFCVDPASLHAFDSRGAALPRLEGAVA